MAVQTQPNPTAGPQGSVAPDAAPTTPARRVGWFHAVNQLTKPRITLMVLFTAALGFAMAVRFKSHGPENLQLWLSPGTWEALFWMLIGTGLSCMAAGIFNQVIERHSDRLMPRTASRPLPTGQIGIPAAMVIALAMTVAGLYVLAVYNNVTTAVLSALTILSYALVYTPMKRMTHISTIVGAVPGAIPPVMGYTAFRPEGLFSVEPLILFAILFLWQLPHFLAIAWLYKDDYERAGLPMLPVIDDDYKATARQILLCCLILVPLTTLPTMFHMAGGLYLVGSMVICMLVLLTAVRLYTSRTRANARVLFFALLLYLPLTFGLMFLDQK